MHWAGNTASHLTHWLLLSFTVLLGSGLWPSNAAESAGTNVLFILDASGSMWEKPQGQGKTKIAMAKEKMTELIRGLPPSTRIGLEVYGHREKGNCEDIELLVPLGQGDKDTLLRRLHAITPKGQTPITRALERAGATLATAEEATTVVLISDGKETCGGDPCAMVRDLRAKGVKVTVHVVGFDVSTDESPQLQCIAEKGGGQYFAVQNALQLKDALGKIVPKTVSAQAESKQPQEKSTVVRVTSGRGAIRLRTPGGVIPAEGVSVYHRESGKWIGELGGFFKNMTLEVSPGMYGLNFGRHLVTGIEVKEGPPTEIFLGAIRLGKSANVSLGVYHQGSKEFIGVLNSGTREDRRALVVPAGTYELRPIGGNPATVVVNAGETVIVE